MVLENCLLIGVAKQFAAFAQGFNDAVLNSYYEYRKPHRVQELVMINGIAYYSVSIS